MKQLLLPMALSAGLALAVDSSARAEDAKGTYAVTGYGTQSCGSYALARKDPDGAEAMLFSTWIGGYLTATNEHLPDTNDISGGASLDELLGWLDNYCRTHPIKNLASAAGQLVLYLHPGRKQQAD